ncbi:hypothetical protein CH352_18900 [Leptospira hartskeerlii]|uniref:Uncharacterized protein n=1 Tax=Leptospira hartskeerlii TaxID=2023177 RepID=A0A2M9X8A3_9LEPT|nr:hypothetical protein [Leptospira hartskeerlii]PJZ23885.1 hypothetical protein CH357_18865 [Leptospira hartskeerlii]PJZ31912.1 hypothetical protein CH352_18900 [Leptospira hartskeerlii]
MISEIKKSIEKVLTERAISPFAGTFLISWLSWNWDVAIALLYSQKEILISDRIFYVNYYAASWCKVILYPILSTFVLLLIYPLLSNLSYWLWLLYEVWKKTVKNKIESQELLTLEESIRIKLELEEMSKKIADIMMEKDRTIEGFKREKELIGQMYKNSEEELSSLRAGLSVSKSHDVVLYENIKESYNLKEALHSLFESYSKDEYRNSLRIPKKILEYFYVNDILLKEEMSNSKIVLGSAGHNIYKMYVSENVNSYK